MLLVAWPGTPSGVLVIVPSMAILTSSQSEIVPFVELKIICFVSGYSILKADVEMFTPSKRTPSRLVCSSKPRETSYRHTRCLP